MALKGKDQELGEHLTGSRRLQGGSNASADLPQTMRYSLALLTLSVKVPFESR